ncbi:hypothetical protein JQU17_00470 [Ponticoccus sp. SC2-23]|uniref:hypothetical protein n=1 Tax=Alexandriicola marinus TaxID=2081710 RepID=UPI000FDAC578|nr:hypothetical protein [Alexandriicola marinus]MBM1218652.1 hypothetical protein [Ponticoccus sp. SC6-9]MBM1224276.1 hypothetical protein [Ponticoccus sp. SC6-15]MBM1229945.1 hypothetical protein [Ponticoccus sp. SC6-38]MBM1233242.1 hypothetical protein [Ponticoccus sp. SC6-45]MBM1236808.1 hypothetical protein [Ponticoccus sp. SC6-49]MBM1242253.1 hypothetical protein [Ponticoccus sp. SC2-64]MBM1246766.1 hypothetical protein [Ponticoccus sp. SC6-42]MBM1251244.1 hypothetical protein [Pontico
MTMTILTLTAAYALVVSLLAYLLLLSRLHWVFKVLSTAATIALIPLTFNAVGELRGMPSDGPIPPSFRMLWAEIVEPNQLQGETGRVFLWLQQLDSDNYPVGQPRAYQLPYSDDLRLKISQAMGEIAAGEAIQGTVDAEETLPEATAEALAQEIEGEIAEGPPTGSPSVGQRFYMFDPSILTFGSAPAPVTPEKPQ